MSVEPDADGWCKYPGKLLYNYDYTSSYIFTSLSAAKVRCLAQRRTCSGITQEPGGGLRFTLRNGKQLFTSVTGETTWVYNDCKPIPSAADHSDLTGE